MPHVNNLNFPEFTFAFKFLRTIEDNFGNQKQHTMKERSISNEKTSLVLKKSVSALSNITDYDLHFH